MRPYGMLLLVAVLAFVVAAVLVAVGEGGVAAEVIGYLGLASFAGAFLFGELRR